MGHIYKMEGTHLDTDTQWFDIDKNIDDGDLVDQQLFLKHQSEYIFKNKTIPT